MVGREQPYPRAGKPGNVDDTCLTGESRETFHSDMESTHHNIFQNSQGVGKNSNILPRIKDLKLSSFAADYKGYMADLVGCPKLCKMEAFAHHVMDVEEIGSGSESAMYSSLDVLPLDYDLKLTFDDLHDQLLFSPEGQQPLLGASDRHQSIQNYGFHTKQYSCPNGTLEDTTFSSESPEEIAIDHLASKIASQRPFSSPLSSMSMPDPRWSAYMESQTDTTTMMDTEALIESFIKDAESVTNMSSPTERWEIANKQTQAHNLNSSGHDSDGQSAYAGDSKWHCESAFDAADDILCSTTQISDKIDDREPSPYQFTAPNGNGSSFVDRSTDYTGQLTAHENILSNLHSTDGGIDQFQTITSAADTAVEDSLFDVGSGLTLQDLHNRHRDTHAVENTMSTNQLNGSYYAFPLEPYVPKVEPGLDTHYVSLFQYNDFGTKNQEDHHLETDECANADQIREETPSKYSTSTDRISTWLDRNSRDLDEASFSGGCNTTARRNVQRSSNAYEYARSNSLQPTQSKDEQFQTNNTAGNTGDIYEWSSFQGHDIRHMSRPLSFDGSSNASIFSSSRRDLNSPTDMGTQTKMGEHNMEISRQQLITHSSKKRDKSGQVDAQRNNTENNTVPNSGPQAQHGSIVMELCSPELWRRFKMDDTEMIMSAKGRQMFPQLRVIVKGLDPEQHYAVWLHFSTEDKSNQCWKWSSERGKWEVREKTKKQMLIPVPSNPNFEVYNHPWVSATGKKWMDEPISFDKLRLTNDKKNPEYVLLAPFRRYVPVLYIIPVQVEEGSQDLVMDGNVNFFRIALATFISSSAYHNPKMASLKIETNPMAKSQRNRLTKLSSRLSGGRQLSVSPSSGTSQSTIFDISKHKNEHLVAHRRLNSTPSQRLSPYTPHASDYKSTTRNTNLRRASLQPKSTYTTVTVETSVQIRESAISATRKYSLAQTQSSKFIETPSYGPTGYEATLSAEDSTKKINELTSSAHSLAASINRPFIPVSTPGKASLTEDAQMNSNYGL